jgi:hypothetical protein
MITLLKLKDGTEVVGKALSDSKEGIVLSDPFVVFYKPSLHGAMPSVGLFRYMPFSSEQVMFFNTTDIRHAVIPSKAFESYYESCLNTFREQLDVEIDRELIEATNSSSKNKEMQELYVALLERAENDGMLN